jgi:endonuclease YncB( thermonuclease family)
MRSTILQRMIVLLALSLTACQPSPFVIPSASASSTLTFSPTASFTPTPKPSATPSYTATSTPTITLTPTITPSPTEDLSFYGVAACLPTDTAYQRAIVIKIIDGDSVEIELGEGITNTLRYIGMDAPEAGFPFFEEASGENADLVLRKQVVLVKDQSDVDRYNRLLRYVIVDGVFVNLELLREGLARAENYAPDEACKDVFAAAELEAKQSIVGMWLPTPTPGPYAGQVAIRTVNKREEWVDIQNVGEYDVDLAGWNLVSERGHQDCPLSGILKAGEILRIWAMQAQEAGFSCGYNSPIWNNSEPDPAVLYNAQGVEVSRK